jgi:hypothetical protein
MPKLIMDEATMQMLVSKLRGYPVHLGPNGGLLQPGVVDVVDGNEEQSPWQPGDARTKLIVLSAEACSEIVFSAERFDDRSARTRTLKNLTVPVCSLMDLVHRMLSSLNDGESRAMRQQWPVADQNLYIDAGRRLRKVHLNGPVRKVRHALGAHLDPDVFQGETRLKTEDCLQAMGDVLILFQLALNHAARAFSWIRPIGRSDDGTRLMVETMYDYPACVRWVTDSDGRVLDVKGVFLAADPRHDVRDRMLPAIDTYNRLVKSAEVRLPTIWMRPSSELHAEEAGAARA